MLELERGIDDAFVIGDDIKVTIVDIVGQQVRLGITAPKSTSIHREEVYNRMNNIPEGHRSVIVSTGMSPRDENGMPIGPVRQRRGYLGRRRDGDR